MPHLTDHEISAIADAIKSADKMKDARINTLIESNKLLFDEDKVRELRSKAYDLGNRAQLIEKEFLEMMKFCNSDELAAIADKMGVQV